ncbi:hypothetical protein Skr01_51860 [Sphaerisporangium krabiense]|uniref:Lantibiotic dehydratase N-terminal domain-containing protein n=1 Tax=Sphaerisporangium krabiense TaxID=763782 RepID=A0A7W8ZA63_9ACTN|nr:lantibiotic dehydratase [Sphaerisporangium krabiense]MBB5630150.1 hypothetical protein [Sphaerisporangium krabiense]GII65101.1 hypothetical protein Skr01_51860 [Sphaerisporangium krabiense]
MTADPGRWRPAPLALLRRTGFPFEWLGRLTRAEVAEALAAHRAAGEALAAACAEFTAEVFPAAVREQEAAGAPAPAFKALYRVRKAAERAEAPPARALADVEALGPGTAAWAAHLRAAVAELDARAAELDAAAGRALDGARGALWEAATSAPFREAVLLSNPGAYERVLHGAPGVPAASRNAKARRDEGLLYAYLQRFCAKNESVSFFGPVDAVRVDPASPEPLRLEREPGALLRRWPRAAHWAAEALGARLAADPGIQARLPLRLAPGFAAAADGRALTLPDGRRARLDEASRAVLLACDRGLTLAEFEEKAAPEESAAAARLLARGVIRRDPQIPTTVDDPLAWLDGALTGLFDPAEEPPAALAGIGAFQRAVRAFAEAGPDGKADALREAERCFTELSGAEARRAAGTIYADRLIVTEDCRGDVVDAAVGGPLLSLLSERLDPVLRLSASYALTLAEAVHARALALHAELTGGGARAGFLAFIAELDRRVQVDELTADPAVAAFLDRLAGIVRDRDRDGAADLDVADVAPLLRPLPPGLAVSPDVFLAAPSEDALRHGDLDVIVGEIHHGVQVWTHLTALTPGRDGYAAELAALLELDGRPPAALVHRRTQGKAFERDLPGLDVEVLGRSAKPGEDRLRAADLSVVSAGGRLRLRHPEAGEPFLRPRDPRAASSWLFGPPPVVLPPLRLPGGAPRVRLGGAVVWRRGWELPREALTPLLDARGPSEALLAADRLRAAHGLPSRVFARVPGERKPFYADLAEPLSLEHLAHMVRPAGGPLRLSELLPGPSGWWLADDRGSYSTELRMTYITRL